MRSTLPTSWGFIPAAGSAETIASVLQDPTAAKAQTPFEELFEFVATSDDSAYICVEAALKFRKEVCGGEEAIMAYCQKVTNEGADAVASILGTEVLQEPGLKSGEESRMRACALTTVRLPIAVADDLDLADLSLGEEKNRPVEGALVTLSSREAARAFAFIQRTLMEKFDTFVPTFQHGPWLWTRLSGQVYLEKADFEWLGGILRELCEQIARNEY
jgi:selenocysteine lyase/cysteine desulfurase